MQGSPSEVDVLHSLGTGTIGAAGEEGIFSPLKQSLKDRVLLIFSLRRRGNIFINFVMMDVDHFPPVSSIFIETEIGHSLEVFIVCNVELSQDDIGV